MQRIQAKLEEHDLSERGAALAAGLSASAIRNLREGKSESPRLVTLKKLAPVLHTTPEWLAFGLENVGTFGGEPRDARAQIETSPIPLEAAAPVPAVVVAYAGVVEAGAFRPVEDLDDDPERPPLWEPADREFPDLPLVYWDVAGDSMNALKPRPIMPGDRVIGIPFEAFRGRFALRDGIVVIVEQSLDGGHHRERSVKQLELYEDRVEFHPRSSNRKHKPIIVPRTIFTDPSEGDGRQVNVLAIARRISNELPL